MSNDTLARLVQRLEGTERELAATQLQVRALQAMPRSRSRLDPVALMLGLVLTFTVTRALDSHAQAGLQALTVKAPFTGMHAEGTKPLLQLRDLGNGSVAFTIGGHTDSTGGVQLSVPASG